MKKITYFLILLFTNVMLAQVANQPSDLEVCDDDDDGIFCFDLSSQNAQVLGSQNLADYTISYHVTQSDADTDINPLAPNSYCNSTSVEIIFVRLEDNASGGVMFDTTNFQIIVNARPFVPDSSSLDLFLCDDSSADGFATFDLTILQSQIFGGQSTLDFTLGYFVTEQEALIGLNPIVDPSSFTNITPIIQTIWIRLSDNYTGCFTIGFFNIVVNEPLNIAGPTPYELCNADGSGFQLFQLSSRDAEIANGLDVTITYHETPEDAQNNVNPITGNYVNINAYSQTIYARAENSITDCSAVVALDLIVTDTCLPITYFSSTYVCDDDTDGLICFDLTSRLQAAIGAVDPADVTATYHLSSSDTYTNSNAITDPTNFCTTEVEQSIHIRVENIVTGYLYERVFILGGVIIYASTPTPYVACDDDADGFAQFIPASKIQEITSGNTGYRVNFYETLADAQAETNVLADMITNTTSSSQTIYARVEPTSSLYNSANCSKIVSVELIASTTICATTSDDTYEVSTIPHTIYDINATPTSNLDDYFTDVITMPFDFEFFNATYNEFTIGTNGLITFNTFNANTNCAWNLENDQLVPSIDLYLNSIFGVYHDLDNIGDGVLGYGVIGEAPFRKMVIFFDDMNQFSQGCTDPTTTQIVLYETFNIIDVQVKEKLACPTWNSGLAALGIQNQDASVGYTPVDRNMGVWDAINEGHRFEPISTYENAFSVLCDTNADGFVEFDLQSINSDLLGQDAGTVSYYVSEDDLLNSINVLPTLYTNTSNGQKIYARIINSTTNEVIIKTVTLAGISCAEDYDLDGVDTLDEDVNQDGNLGNDDTDGDGIPDFVDEDDDGDYVLTNLELINTATGLPENSFIDTDNDMIPNHRDADDDGDGTLTIDEDYNGNNNPEDDDTNNNNIPDYLDTLVFLDVDEFATTDARVYPNPVKDKLIIETVANVRIQNIEIYSVDGRLVHVQNQATPTNNLTVDVRDFASGFYLLRIKSQNNTVLIKRFIVE